MVTRQVEIVNPLGMHARAAARFVSLASGFTSHIQVAHGSRTTDGKSILGLLMLTAARGSQLAVSADGADEQAALDALCGLVERGFDDA